MKKNNYASESTYIVIKRWKIGCTEMFKIVAEKYRITRNKLHQVANINIDRLCTFSVL